MRVGLRWRAGGLANSRGGAWRGRPRVLGFPSGVQETRVLMGIVGARHDGFLDQRPYAQAGGMTMDGIVSRVVPDRFLEGI